MRGQSGYKSFAPLFKGAKADGLPPYWRLLSLAPDEETANALEMVRQSLARSPDPDSEIVALLTDINWRVHGVAAAAILLGAGNDTVFGALWDTLDCGSGAAPQLATAAFLRDPDFIAHARQRIESGGATDREEIAERTNLRLRRFYLPERFGPYSPRALITLVTLCQQLPDSPAWLTDALADPTIQSRLAEDWERSDRATVAYLRNARAVILGERTPTH